MCFLVPCRAGRVSPMSPVPSLLSLLKDCAGQEGPPAQSLLHPNPLQTLLLPWPLGAVCGYGNNAWPVPSSVPTLPSPVPAGLGTQLALLWQQPEVLECHHLLLHPCPSQGSAASPTAEPSGCQAGWPRGPAAFPVPGPQVRDKGHPVGLSLLLGWMSPPSLAGLPISSSAGPTVPVPGSSGAISPTGPALPCGSGCHVCCGCRAPSLGCSSTSGHGSGAAVVHGVGEQRAGLSPRPLRVPVPHTPAALPARLRQDL